MNLSKNIYAFLMFSCLSTQSLAFPCYLTLIKDNCWQEYDVTFRVFDAATDKVLATILAHQDQSWGRQSFECRPKQTFRFEAQFSPAIWQADVDKKYAGKRYWSTPASIDGAVAWNINVCFSDDFSSVPMPPSANKCHCDVSVAPPIPKKSP